jgi:hypothetical protein
MRRTWYWFIPTAITTTLCISVSSVKADKIYEPYGTWNGYKVYLSPARHTDSGARGECKGTSENTMAANAAAQAATGTYYNDVSNPSSSYRNLRARGYQVRIGDGTLRSAIDNSNAWGANIHIPLHSNADVSGQCTRTSSSQFGTLTIYYSSSSRGLDLANKLRETLGSSSPGTSDSTCKNPGDPCTTINLGELRETKAVAAYVESDYHTWNTGVDWLIKPNWWWRIGWGVDRHLGYPRN